MALDDRTVQEKLTPDERREYLRAFGDRMLLKVTSMDDPEDMPGVERCVRVAAVIERLYSRCDRAEAQTPDPGKLEAARARNAVDAIEQRVALATTLKWGEGRRKDQGHWWDDAKAMAQGQPAQAVAAEADVPVVTDVAPQNEPEQIPQVTLPSADDLPKTQPETLQDTQPDTTTAQDEPVAQTPAVEEPEAQSLVLPEVTYVDYTDAIRAWRVELGLSAVCEDEQAHPEDEPPP